MKKKKLVITIFIVLIIAIIAIVVAICMQNDHGDGYDFAAQGLKVEFNADIMVYGEDPKFRKNVEYRKIDAITEETLASGEEHGYRAIILFDRKGTMSITDEELLLIKEYVEEKAYDMIYIGLNYLDDFKRLGFTVDLWEDAYSLEYIGSIHEGKEVQQNSTGNLYAQHGLWTGEDEERFGKSDEVQDRMICIMYDYARWAAGVEF